MNLRDPTVWMWGEALEMLERADRLQRQFFRPACCHERYPNWEPPIDLFEAERELVVFAALPGVRPEQLDISVESEALVIRGQRAMPEICKHAALRRLEIPYGRFERRIELPAGQFELGQHVLMDGCLTLTLRKLK